MSCLLFTDNTSDNFDGAAAAVRKFGTSLGFTLKGQEDLQLIICNEYCFQIYHDARPLQASMSHVLLWAHAVQVPTVGDVGCQL